MIEFLSNMLFLNVVNFDFVSWEHTAPTKYHTSDKGP